MQPDVTMLLRRLQDALAPDFRVERELARGGMGAVFLAHDTRLRRRVAIKVLLPEIATEATVARFLREARVLAALSHSHIVPVHEVGDADGLNYYVMDYLVGDTLEDRLRAGPLGRHESVKLARDLLDALEVVHDAGVIHRDIKPANIFLVGRRTVLGDFGIAHAPSDQTDTLTGAGGIIGTPAYMPPEQQAGLDVTPQTDIYGVAMVIYEALTTRRWVVGQEPRDGNWLGVPRALIPILSRALAYSPRDRWRDARTFRKRIWATRVIQYRWRAAALTAGGLAAGILLPFVWPPLTSPDPTGKLTLQIRPFDVRGEASQAGLGDSAAARVRAGLGKISEFHVLPAGIESDLQPAVVLGGTLVFGDAVSLDVRSLGSTSSVVSAQYAADDWMTAADSVVAQTMRELWSTSSPLAKWLPMDALPSDPQAFDRWLKAEILLGEGRWADARQEFENVFALDATCLLCSWRITEIQRWLRGPDPDSVHEELLLAGLDRFPPHYRGLIQARLGPDIGRLRLLEDAADRWDDYYYAWFLLSEERLNRGPLLGFERANAARSLEQAADLRPDFAPIWWDLAWLNIAEGEQRQARDALNSIPAPGDPFSAGIYELLELAYAYRFGDALAAERRLAVVFHDPVTWNDPKIRSGPRYMPSFGTPEGAVQYGELYAMQESVPAVRRSGLIAQLFGFFALGQTDSVKDRTMQLHRDFPTEGFVSFVARLNAVNWMFDSSDAAGLDQLIESLQRFARPGLVQGDAAGARWMLQLLEQHPGGLIREWPYSDVATGDPARDTIAVAARLARQGNVQEAIDVANTVGELEIARFVNDQFLRTVLHLLKARWYESIGNLPKAVEELRWHEAVDEDDSPGAGPLVQEVDWAFGTLARWKRAQLLDRIGDTEGEICRSFDAVARLWQAGAPPYKSRADTARLRYQALGCGS